jgi:cyclic pyranopterin phosphate synthase
MPADGMDWLPAARLLTFAEIDRIVGVLVDCGITAVKLTGGEPLMRKNLPELVSMLRERSPDLDLSMTTNGSLLERHAHALAVAGLDRVTVSCDSLTDTAFEAIALRDAFESVMRGLDAADNAGLGPIKINTVIVRGINDGDIVPFAELSRERDYDVRFIEYMPLDAQAEWTRDQVVTGEEIIATIHRNYPLVAEDEAARGAAPAASYRFADGAPGSIGAIDSVTKPFCASCDRLRLTADGSLRACLFSLDEVDLRAALRLGADDDQIEELVRGCVDAKWAGHNIGAVEFQQPARSMSMIGG